MWPFNLPGPSFLGFYLVFGLVSVLLFYILQIQREAKDANSQRGARRRLTDPYAIAFMRGGADEAIRVAIVSLIDRKLLVENDGVLHTPDDARISTARRPLERAVLASCAGGTATLEGLLKKEKVLSACGELELDLQKQGLLASPETYRERAPLLWLFFGALALVAGLKLIFALTAGRTNVIVLVIMVIGFLFWTWGISRRKKTGLSATVMRDLRSLFSGLKSRASSLKSGGGSTEAVMLAAVFGVAALPAAEFPYVKRLFPQPTGGDSGSSDSGSSCSSGSSCGGGGGCGGCGG